MRIFRILSFVLSISFSFASLASDFQPLSTIPTTAFCFAAEDIDSSEPTGCKITNGAITGTDSFGNLYDLPDGTPAVFPDSPSAPSVVLTMVASNTQDILLNGNLIGQPTAGIVKVGTLTDYVLRDTRDDNLVFGMRVILEPTVNGNANQYEINNLFRFGFTGFSAATGWSRGSDADLRLYNAARTRQRFLTSEPFTFDPDVVRLQSDVNVSESNPRSGYFFVKSDASNYSTQTNAISLYQAGEESQPINEVFFTGFVPATTSNTTPVPLPMWALVLFAAVLGYLGCRRLKI